MHERDVLPPQVRTHLAGRLEERLGLDVPHRPPDLSDDDIGHLAVGAGSGLGSHDAFDLVGDVRDDLNSVPQVLPAALLGDDRGVDLAGGRIGCTGEVDIQKALVVADVEIGFGAVLGHEDLPVLEGVHRAGVDVDVRVELQTGGGQSLAQGGDDSPGDENVAGDVGQASTQARTVAVHGPST